MMLTLRKGTALLAVTCSTLVGLGVSAPAGQAAPTSPASATTASTMPGTSCTEASRFFQVRAGGTELWYASMNQANRDTPTVYSWRKIYDIPRGKGESIAAHSSTPESEAVHLVLSDEHGALRTLNYNKAEGKISLDRTIAPGTATNPGAYRFTSLTSDGEKLYGTRGGDLYVMTSITGDEAPKGKAKVSGIAGLWPQAFYGNPAGDYDIAWTNSEGTLTYGDVRSPQAGQWELGDTNTLNSGYGSKAMTSPGGGILLRSTGDNLIRYQSTETGLSEQKTISTTWNVNNTYPLTTVPDVCRLSSSSPGPSAPEANPHGPSVTTAPNATPRTSFVERQVEENFPIDCWVGGYRDYESSNTDHNTGNALDCTIGTIGQLPSASDKAEGDQLAAWLREHAATLDIQYVIWNQRIWNIDRASEGWRDMEDRGSVTANHKDHVHISMQR